MLFLFFFGLFKIRSIFEYIFNRIWLGFWIQHSMNNWSISIPCGISKNNKFLDRFFYRFWFRFGASLEPYWLPFSAQNGPRSLQDDLKTPPRWSQNQNRGTRSAHLGYPISPPGLGIMFGPFWRPAWPSNNEFVWCFLGDFCMKFNRF